MRILSFSKEPVAVVTLLRYNYNRFRRYVQKAGWRVLANAVDWSLGMAAQHVGVVEQTSQEELERRVTRLPHAVRYARWHPHKLQLPGRMQLHDRFTPPFAMQAFRQGPLR
jgi:hypothetical protein